MFDFIAYPVSFILWCWHKVFGSFMGPQNGFAWALSIVFLVFTLRAILFKPFVSQVRSMKKMQEFAPQMKAIQKKYANDRTRQAEEMRKLQQTGGFNPIMGCLPILLQIPVFIGLNFVLHGFNRGAASNYFFGSDDVSSYVTAKIFGADLSNFIFSPAAELAQVNVERIDQIVVSIPLMIVASIATHITARHSVARQNPATATGQTAIMNKLSLYIFPFGVLVFGCFFPMGLLLYWLSNNVWTLFQQRLVYHWMEKEEAAAKEKALEQRKSLAPKPGQKPRPGQKPQQQKKPGADATEAVPDDAEVPEPAASNGSGSGGGSGGGKGGGKNSASGKNGGQGGKSGAGGKSNGAAKQGKGKIDGPGGSSGSSSDWKQQAARSVAGGQSRQGGQNKSGNGRAGKKKK